MFVLSIKEIENFKGCPLPAYFDTFNFSRHTMLSRTGHLSFALIVVPIIGMDMIHKYGWEHWEPFDKCLASSIIISVHSTAAFPLVVQEWRR